MDELPVQIPASLVRFAVEGQLMVGNALMVTSTTMSAPGHPSCEAELMVYSTTAFPLPVFTSTSGMVLPQPPGQSTLPLAEPLITADDQLKSVPVTVELIPTFAAPPLYIVVLDAVTTGVAPTVATYVNELPVQPDEVGIIEYVTISSVVPELLNDWLMPLPQPELQLLYPLTFPDDGLAVHV